MEARMNDPSFVGPGARPALEAFGKAVQKAGLPASTLDLVHLRVSQIDGCSGRVDRHAHELESGGESNERISAVDAWREAPYFTDAERAALALAEAVTRLNERSDPVPDDVWDEASRHYNEAQLAALTVSIGLVNLSNRLHASRQVAGAAS